MIDNVFTHPQEVLDLIAAKCAAVYGVPKHDLVNPRVRGRGRAYARCLLALVAYELGVDDRDIADAMLLTDAQLRHLLNVARRSLKRDDAFVAVYRGIMTYFQE